MSLLFTFSASLLVIWAIKPSLPEILSSHVAQKYCSSLAPASPLSDVYLGFMCGVPISKHSTAHILSESGFYLLISVSSLQWRVLDRLAQRLIQGACEFRGFRSFFASAQIIRMASEIAFHFFLGILLLMAGAPPVLLRLFLDKSARIFSQGFRLCWSRILCVSSSTLWLLIIEPRSFYSKGLRLSLTIILIGETIQQFLLKRQEQDETHDRIQWLCLPILILPFLFLRPVWLFILMWLTLPILVSILYPLTALSFAFHSWVHVCDWVWSLTLALIERPEMQLQAVAHDSYDLVDFEPIVILVLFALNLWKTHFAIRPKGQIRSGRL